MLEKLCISSLLGEIKCYPNKVRRNKYCNSTFIVEALRRFSHIKKSLSHYYIFCFIFYYLLIAYAPILYLHQRGELIMNFPKQWYQVLVFVYKMEGVILGMKVIRDRSK